VAGGHQDIKLLGQRHIISPLPSTRRPDLRPAGDRYAHR